ncbi:MAG: DUF4198 domain-containing protein [Pirellulaceae bacterium]|nr:DUF4198 domain-containing protein [Pirellulaceae bacterium]
MQCRTIGVCLLGLAAVVFAGCGSGEPDLVKAKGKVLYNGKPVSGANVTFTPASGPLGLGMTDANGEFSLTTGGRPGVLVGEHKVSIAKAPPAPVQMASPTPDDMRKMQMSGGMTTEPVKSEIPEKYANPATSNLVAAVDPDETKNVFEYALVD